MTQKETTIIRYDGAALADHSIDVAHLAPSLLALSEIIKNANKLVNGDKAGIKVMVNANLEQNCFELNLELMWSVYEQAKSLVGHEDVQSLKEILEWLGIIGGGAITGGIGFWQLIKVLKGRKIESAEIFERDGKNLVRIKTESKNVEEASKEAFQLYSNVNNRRLASEFLSPLKEDGYDNVEFDSAEKGKISFTYDDAPDFAAGDLPPPTPEMEKRNIIRTSVRIKKAVYEGNAKWDVVYKQVVQVSIKDADWLTLFQKNEVDAPPGSLLDVELEEIYLADADGLMLDKAHYEITKVHNVISAEEQLNMRDI